MVESKAPNKAFSERHPENAENEPFSSKSSFFLTFPAWSTGRSSVENDRPPSFDGALDAGDSGEIPSSFLHLSLFLLGRLRAVRPSASNAIRWAVA